jgi:MscS family membrane protein
MFADPLGRQTPAGTVTGFLDAVGRRDLSRAAKYLDTKLPEDQAEELAQELKILLDRALSVDLGRISRNPEGERDSRFGKDRELIGTIDGDSGTLNVLLVRVRRADEPPVWLFAPETLHAVPRFQEDYKPSAVEEYLPASLRQGQGGWYRLWSWIFVVAVCGVAFIMATLLARLGNWALKPAATRIFGGGVGARHPALVAPWRWLLFGIIARAAAPHLLTLQQRYGGERFGALLIAGALTWLAVGIVGHLMGRWIAPLERQGTTEKIAPLRLASRLLQVGVVIIGGLGLLKLVGVNMTPVLAGLGVGGIAVALASQKTLENLFGGMMVIGDSPVRIGQFCRVGTMVGTIEDIGLRSTRIRTLARTIISIPNADLATMSLENFAARDKLLFQQTFTLRYETTLAQLRLVVAGMRQLLDRHAEVEESTARVRLLRLAPSGFEVEAFAYVMTTEYETFLAVQEDLLLRLMDVIAASGTALAFPSQTMYVAKDGGLESPHAVAAPPPADAARR